MPRAELRSLIDLIDEAFDKRAWHRGSNWFDVDGTSFKTAVRLLVDEHRALRATVAALTPNALARRVRGCDTAATTVGLASRNPAPARGNPFRRLRSALPAVAAPPASASPPARDARESA